MMNTSHHSSFIVHHSFIMPDLFDFFRENESKLEERPSEKVWQKLESRLEKRTARKRRRIRFLQIGAVLLAIFLLLLAAAAVLLMR